MASLIDIFNPSFFVFLGILVLVVALLVVYFESKMREQNHKITSMFSLVSSMADELNIIKCFSLNSNNGPEATKIQTENIVTKNPKLIEVSDDDDESSSSSEDTDYEDEGEESEIIEIGGHNDIKVLSMTTFNSKDDKDIVFEDIDDIDVGAIEEDDDSSSSSSEDEEEEHSAEVKEPDFSFKSINISIEEGDNNKSTDLDYKKLSISRLRKIVQEKKLAEDASKLKKNELLRLLDE
jgi:hypothetical protein